MFVSKVCDCSLPVVWAVESSTEDVVVCPVSGLSFTAVETKILALTVLVSLVALVSAFTLSAVVDPVVDPVANPVIDPVADPLLIHVLSGLGKSAEKRQETTDI